jgi:uncharacterized membrane protein YdbT with pleckstrin-like domain
MFCTQCGTGNEEDAKFCRQCGHPMAPRAPSSVAPSPAPIVEEPLWQGSPSQLINAGRFVLCGLLTIATLCLMLLHPLLGLAALVPLLLAGYEWLDVRCQRYQITSQRLIVVRGILSKQTENMELYRIEDITLVQPFYFRFFGLGNLVLRTADATTPRTVLRAVPTELRELLRQHVETCRTQRRVTELRLQQ